MTNAAAWFWTSFAKRSASIFPWNDLIPKVIRSMCDGIQRIANLKSRIGNRCEVIPKCECLKSINSFQNHRFESGPRISIIQYLWKITVYPEQINFGIAMKFSWKIRGFEETAWKSFRLRSKPRKVVRELKVMMQNSCTVLVSVCVRVLQKEENSIIPQKPKSTMFSQNKRNFSTVACSFKISVFTLK